jgi:hypothetical protein
MFLRCSGDWVLTFTEGRVGKFFAPKEGVTLFDASRCQPVDCK